jgi:hypothetical protein
MLPYSVYMPHTRPLQIASTVRVMLQQLKASAPEAAPQHFLAALKALYEEAIGEESAGQEEHTGDALQHLAAVSYRVASLYSGGLAGALSWLTVCAWLSFNTVGMRCTTLLQSATGLQAYIVCRWAGWINHDPDGPHTLSP